MLRVEEMRGQNLKALHMLWKNRQWHQGAFYGVLGKAHVHRVAGLE